MTATISATTHAREAYEAMAPVYDAFTIHHRYALWTDVLERLLRPHGLVERGRLLDVGCGTGKSFQPWEARGWSIVGCDLSETMIAFAAAKAAPGTETLVADARDLPHLGAFDLVTMTDDVVNYLAPEERVAAFNGVKRNLGPSGLFVFDVNTLLTYRTYFGQVDVRDAEGCFVVWRGDAAPDLRPGAIAEAVFDAFVLRAEGCWERRRGRHRQYHHPIDQLEAALHRAGLRLCSVDGVDAECRTGPLEELCHVKAIVVAASAER